MSEIIPNFDWYSSEADIDMVKRWLCGWATPVTLSAAEPAPDRFELLLKDFEVVGSP